MVVFPIWPSFQGNYWDLWIYICTCNIDINSMLAIWIMGEDTKRRNKTVNIRKDASTTQRILQMLYFVTASLYMRHAYRWIRKFHACRTATLLYVLPCNHEGTQLHPHQPFRPLGLPPTPRRVGLMARHATASRNLEHASFINPRINVYIEWFVPRMLCQLLTVLVLMVCLSDRIISRVFHIDIECRNIEWKRERDTGNGDIIKKKEKCRGTLPVLKFLSPNEYPSSYRGENL